MRRAFISNYTQTDHPSIARNRLVSVCLCLRQLFVLDSSFFPFLHNFQNFSVCDFSGPDRQTDRLTTCISKFTISSCKNKGLDRADVRPSKGALFSRNFRKLNYEVLCPCSVKSLDAHAKRCNSGLCFAFLNPPR